MQCLQWMQTVRSLAGIQTTQTQLREALQLPQKLQWADLVNSFIGNPAWSGNSLCIFWEVWQGRDKMFLPWGSSWDKAGQKQWSCFYNKGIFGTLWRNFLWYQWKSIQLFLFKNQTSPLSSRKPKVVVTTRVTKRKSFFSLLLSSYGICLSITHLFV